MRRRSITFELPADATTAFDVVHDYANRLNWDAMLSKAVLLDGAKSAAVGVRSLCVGDWTSGFIPMETEYISFARGERAAVKLTRGIWFFDRFAASIVHRPIDLGSSQITYTYAFRLRPRWLSKIVTPLVDRLLAREVRGRLRGLKKYLLVKSWSR